MRLVAEWLIRPTSHTAIGSRSTVLRMGAFCRQQTFASQEGVGSLTCWNVRLAEVAQLLASRVSLNLLVSRLPSPVILKGWWVCRLSTHHPPTTLVGFGGSFVGSKKWRFPEGKLALGKFRS